MKQDKERGSCIPEGKGRFPVWQEEQVEPQSCLGFQSEALISFIPCKVDSESRSVPGTVLVTENASGDKTSLASGAMRFVPSTRPELSTYHPVGP